MGPVIAVGEVDKAGLHTGKHFKIKSLEFTRGKMLQINMEAELPGEVYFILNVPATTMIRRAFYAEARRRQRKARKEKGL